MTLRWNIQVLDLYKIFFSGLDQFAAVSSDSQQQQQQQQITEAKSHGASSDPISAFIRC